MVNNKNFFVIKGSGEQEQFSPEKYRRSLHRSGLSEQDIAAIWQDIAPLLHEGITTRELYKKTYQLLTHKEPRKASIYSLKDALRLLGPTGFPFEKLVAKILEHEGYEVKVGVILQGKCVTHETDVLADKNGEHILVECKFHHLVGVKSDVQTALAVKARFDDISAVHQRPISNCMLVTNTQFSRDAIQYGECSQIRMIAWGYPAERGIAYFIEKYDLYPITVLTRLRQDDAAQLLKAGIILCSDLIKQPQKLIELGIPQHIVDQLVHEAQSLCHTKLV